MRKLKKLYIGTLLTAGVLALASCGNDKKEEKKTELTGINASLSSKEYNIDKEYYYSDYNTLQQASHNTTVFENKDDIVYQAVTWEELTYLFEQEGNYLILFGGSWCHNTRAAAGYINEYAKQYGIKTIYNFDFRLDSATRDTHLRETNGSTAKAAQYNYLYGELISKYIPNLTDWVEYKEDTKSALTYTNASAEDVTVAKAQVPFLFLYNKDNTVDNSENKATGTGKKFPIVYGFEEMVDKDETGVYTQNYTTKEKTYITEEYKERLEKIFKYIDTNKVKLNEYGASEYIKDSYNEKSKKELFKENDSVNINTLSYRELKWLLEQEGNSLVLLGGSWCGNTQAVINTINDYAVSNDLVVYTYDTKIDGGLSKTEKFGYTTDLNTRASNFPLVNLYTDLIENYLTNIETLYDVDAAESYKRIEYTNASGEVVKVKKAQVPYLFAYNKDNKDDLGLSAPITGYHEQMLVLSEDKDSYVYKTENYTEYRNGVKNVLEGYSKYTNITVKDITSRI